MDEMFEKLRDDVARARKAYENEKQFLNERVPETPFAREERVGYVFQRMLRTLVLNAKSHPLTDRNDGIDFCHATLAASYAGIAALDKHGKRRVTMLGLPAELLRVYYGAETKAFVTFLEDFVQVPPGTQTTLRPVPAPA